MFFVIWHYLHDFGLLRSLTLWVVSGRKLDVVGVFMRLIKMFLNWNVKWEKPTKIREKNGKMFETTIFGNIDFVIFM